MTDCLSFLPTASGFFAAIEAARLHTVAIALVHISGRGVSVQRLNKPLPYAYTANVQKRFHR